MEIEDWCDYYDGLYGDECQESDEDKTIDVYLEQLEDLYRKVDEVKKKIKQVEAKGQGEVFDYQIRKNVKENIMKLSSIAGLSQEELSQKAGVSFHTLRGYYTGNLKINVVVLIKIANYFGVPIDFLVGRLDEKDGEKVVSCFEEYYPVLLNSSYEVYLQDVRRKNKKIDLSVVPMYPYNLIKAIFNEDWMDISKEQMDGLKEALGTLSPRERKVIWLRYDREQTLASIAEKFNVSRARIHQIEAKALSKLRHPSRSKLIRDGQQECSDVRDYESENDGWIDEELANNEKCETAARFKITGGMVDMGKRVEDFELSTRAQNCLRRAEIKTVGELSEAILSGRINRIRNLGRITVKELVELMDDYTGWSSYTDWYREN